MMTKGIPQATKARIMGLPIWRLPIRAADMGTAARAPIPAASIKSPTPALPACSSRSDAMTAMAIHIPRTKVRSPLTTSRPPT